MPWPADCKIFQAGDPCNTYEISDDGTFIVSCDIAMVKGQCFPKVKDTFHCLEYCPPEGCIFENWSLKLSLALSAVAIAVMSWSL